MIIKTIEDAGRELKQIRYELDLLRSQNMDLSGRRVINAGRAIADKDYVTLGQAKELFSPSQANVQGNPGWLQVDFAIGLPAEGEDIMPRPVVYLPQNQRGIPVLCGLRARTAPDSGSCTVRWHHYSKYNDNTVVLLATDTLSLSNGQSYNASTLFALNRNIGSQDYFSLDVEEVGGAQGIYTFLVIMVM